PDGETQRAQRKRRGRRERDNCVPPASGARSGARRIPGKGKGVIAHPLLILPANRRQLTKKGGGDPSPPHFPEAPTSSSSSPSWQPSSSPAFVRSPLSVQEWTGVSPPSTCRVTRGLTY